MISKLLDVFERFRMEPLVSDQYEQVGKSMLAAKFKSFVSKNEPIEFVMLGFPFKSMNNRDKVLGVLPDLGEEEAVRNFAEFNRQIREVYPKGVHINIVNDGFLFNDLMSVMDRTVWDYQAANLDTISILSAPVTIFDLTNFYPNLGRLANMREKLMQDFNVSEIELQKRILLDTDTNMLYKGMIHFMEADLAILPYDSRNQLHKAAKDMAKKMMIRNEAYSELVKKEFAHMVRLSMHPSTNSGAKYSFKLIAGPKEKIWTSPWHSALHVMEDGSFQTIHKRDAIEKGLELQYRNGRPYNYAG